MKGNPFGGIFNGKRVLVLGHTGFKGSWLAVWLNKLGADVFGASVDIPTDPSHFVSANIDSLCRSWTLDIRNLNQLKNCFNEAQPEFVFHLAAQALVGRSYTQPGDTFATNLMGTVNVMECVKGMGREVTAIMITSDKAYENVERVQGYREDDRLGGRDPYSASKGCADIAIRAYVESFFKEKNGGAQIAVGRAGNVIGGGDWSEGRLVPDVIRAWSSGEKLSIRSPKATRPWQHVLEPLSGYLHLAAKAGAGVIDQGEAFNFGPRSEDLATVQDIAMSLRESLGGLDMEIVKNTEKSSFHEAGLLKLSCDKALHLLNWRPVMTIKETLDMTSDWYLSFRREPESVLEMSNSQIERYCDLAFERKVSWANSD